VEPALNKTLKDLGVNYLDPLPHALAGLVQARRQQIPKGLGWQDHCRLYRFHRDLEGDGKDGEEWKVQVHWDLQLLQGRDGETAEVCRNQACVSPIGNAPLPRPTRVLEWNKKQGIYLAAYSPLGNQNDTYDKGKKYDKIIATEPVKKVAQKHGVDGGQVVLAWGIERGAAVLPKSVNEGRIKSNLKAWGLKLDAEDMAAIDKLDQKLRFNDPSAGFGYKFYQDLDGHQ